MFAFQKYKFRHFNFLLLLCIIFLSVMGVLIIRSATLSTGDESAFTKQIMGVTMGMVAMLIVSMIDYHWIMRMYLVVYVGMIGILILTVVAGTDAGTGAKRWFSFGPIQIQPSEFAKIAVVVFFARLFQIYEERINEFIIIAASVLFLGIPLVLVMAQPDLSTSLVIMFIFVVMIFTANISYKWVGSVLAVVTPFAATFIFLVENNLIPDTILKGYQRNRILSFLHPQDFPDLARQQNASIMAIGSGGLYGKGLFNESLDSVKNGNYLMEEDTDFIFAVAGEELGFAGCCLIIAILFLVVVECLLTANRAQDMAGRLIATGIGAQIAFQSFVNIGVATFILPNTGLPLPFISAGLSSLLSIFMGAGMIFNIGMQRKHDLK